MRKLFSLLLVAAIITSLNSCGKDGPVGPQGEQGPRGEQGAAGDRGAVGPAGDDGSVMFAGTGKPKANVGATGDYYLDKKTGSLYGPKDSKGWGNPTIVLMGAAGKDGADGKDGKNGVDGEDGADGADGRNGVDGKDGVDGEDGADGADGRNGVDGKDGVDGEDGADGKNGKNGSVIYAGNLAPQINRAKPPLPNPKIGKAGDYFLDKTNYNLFGPKVGIDWGSPINLKGPKGNDGEDGKDGKDGNANVTQYVFGEFDLVSSKIFSIPLGEHIVNHALVYVYIRRGEVWTPVPGDLYGSLWISPQPDHSLVRIAEPSQNAKDWGTFQGLRVIVVEAGKTINLTASAASLPDFNDYDAVRRHYGLLK